MMKRTMCIFKSAMAAILGLALITGLTISRPTPARADGGGSSASIFSLDRTSPSLAGHSPADLFVDDIGTTLPLIVTLTAESLGLHADANIDAISGGRDTGIPAMINLGNPMNFEDIRYQFSVGRQAVDNVFGFINVPLENVVLTYVTRTTDFADQFANNDQAADILDNVYDQALIVNTIGRLNTVAVHQQSLSLSGNPPFAADAIDNIDAFKSVGSFGGYDLDQNGQLDMGKMIFISTDAQTANGFDPGMVYVNTGTNSPGGSGWIVFANLAQLGLQEGDDIDALSVWDVPDTSGQLATFNIGDGVVFSLRAGSPSLPTVIGGVPLDQGGIFLARPGQALVGLPGSYFSLSPGDELDEIFAIDPRQAIPPCSGSIATPVQPMESIVLSPWLVRLDLDPRTNIPDCSQVVVALNDTRRRKQSEVVSYKIEASVTDQTIAKVVSIKPTRQGGLTSKQNLCLGRISICGLRPGATQLNVSVTIRFQLGRVERQTVSGLIRISDAPGSRQIAGN